MRKTRKQFFAVMLALVMCLSQNAALFAAEEIASMTEEVSDNKIPEESVEAEGSVSKNEISENEISENETPKTPISKNEIDEISDSEESANGVEITWGDYTATRDDEAMTLTLTKYNGNASSITVPATATIDGKSYRIVLTWTIKHNDEDNWDYETSIWSDDPNLTSLSFSSGFKAPYNCQYLFADCSKLTNLDLENFDTSYTGVMNAMFKGCSSLTSLDVSSLNTSKVSSMGSMFDGCSSLTGLNLNKFNTSNVTGMHYMFGGCSSLQSLNISNFNTSKVWSMSGMFSGCSSLEILNISNFDTSNVKDYGMHDMFRDCSELINLDLSNFDTSKVTTMDSMFYGCEKLKSLNISNFNTSSVTDMDCMFCNCNELENLDVSSFDTSNVKNMNFMFGYCNSLNNLNVDGFDTSKVTNMSGMFCECNNLNYLNVSGFDTSNVVNMGHLFQGCGNLSSLDVSNFDTSKVTTMEIMFSECSGLSYLDVSGFDTSNVEDMGYMFNDCSNLSSLDVSGFNTSKVKDFGAMFSGCSKLTSIDVSGFDTSKATDYSGMYRMFGDCSQLTSIDVSNFNTSSVTDMQGMFSGCSSLTSLDVSKFDTSNVTDYGMENMFAYCSGLTSLSINNFDTSKVTCLREMFIDCSSLKTLDISNFDTSNVTNMQRMFSGCSSLTSLNLGSLNTSSVTDMSYMFNDCSSLTSLDLSSFDTSNVENMHQMFNNCSSLTSLDLSNFSTGSADENMGAMFNNCTSLTSLDLSGFEMSEDSWIFLKNTPSLTNIKTPKKTGNEPIKLYARFSGGIYNDIDEIPANLTGSINLTRSGTIPLNSISQYQDIKNVSIGSSETLSVQFDPENATDQRLSWESKDPTLASVDKDGRVTGLKPGNVIIKATSIADNTKTLSWTVTVGYKTINKIELNSISRNMIQGEVFTLKAADAENEASNTRNIDPDHIIWSSSTPSVATVDEKGRVTAVKEGSATITATYKGDENVKVECKITVKPGDPSKIRVTGVTLDKAETDVSLNNSVKLTATVEPANAANKAVTWSSADPTTAEVDQNGNVTGKKVGNTVISVTTKDGGYKASCKVNVKVIPLTGISLISSNEVTVGGSVTLTPVFTPADASNKTVTWTVSDSSIATVNNGVVTGVAVGTTVVTVTASEGGFSASCTITVKEKPAPSPTPSPDAGVFTVTFINNGVVYTTQSVKEGSTATVPSPDPSKLGYIFVGWAKGKTLWNFATPVHSDLTLVALFKEEDVSVSANLGSGRDPVPVITPEKEIFLVKGQVFELGGTGWTSSDSAVAKAAKNGKITAKKKGKTTVTNGTDSYYVMVAEPAISDKKITVLVGETKAISLKLNTADDKNEDKYPVTWYTADPKKVLVYDGAVTAIAKGSVKISAYTGGKAYTTTVTVTDTYKAPSKLQKTAEIEMNPLQSFNLKYDTSVFKVKNAVWSGTGENTMSEIKNKNNKVTGYKNSIVEITKAGKIKAVGKGSTVITGTDDNNKSVTLTVKVNPVSTKEVTYITKGKNETLKFANVKNKKADWWKSSAPEKVEVDESKKTGKVTGKAYGSSLVSCSYNGFEFLTTVYVEEPEILYDGVKVAAENNKKELAVGKTAQVKIDKVFQTVNYKSSKSAIAFVDENGFIYARKAGKTNITAVVNGKTYKIVLTVK